MIAATVIGTQRDHSPTEKGKMRSGQSHLAPGKQPEGPQIRKPVWPLSRWSSKVLCHFSSACHPRAQSSLLPYQAENGPRSCRVQPGSQCCKNSASSVFPEHSNHGVEVVKQALIPDSGAPDQDLRFCLSNKLPVAALILPVCDQTTIWSQSLQRSTDYKRRESIPSRYLKE